MEILIAILLIITIYAYFVQIINEGNHIPGIIASAVTLLVLVFWLSNTQKTRAEVEIHTAKSNGIEWLYYNKETEIIPIPSNTKRVMITYPRKGSTNPITYEIILN